jgi:hypothetical protein
MKKLKHQLKKLEKKVNAGKMTKKEAKKQANALRCDLMAVSIAGAVDFWRTEALDSVEFIDAVCEIVGVVDEV